MQIVEWYDELVRLTDNPVARLNRAVAIGEADGPRAGLAALAELDPALPRHTAAAAYLHERDDDPVIAARLYAEAARSAPNLPERGHLTRQAARLNAQACAVERRRRAGVGLRQGTGMVGYSGTPLARKLGIKAGSRVALLGAPEGFDDELAPLPDAVTILRRLGPELDVAVLFVIERRELERRFPEVARSITPAGGFWVAWPKRASQVATDLTEDVLRDVGLPQGLVDNKVCAINAVWSGLRFVWRKENRPRP